MTKNTKVYNFTEEDLIDSFWNGFNFREKTIMTNIKNNILSIVGREIEGRSLPQVAIEKMLKEKKGEII